MIGQNLGTAMGKDVLQMTSHFSKLCGRQRLQNEIHGCVCWGSENVPIMKDALGPKHAHIEGILCILQIHIMV